MKISSLQYLKNLREVLVSPFALLRGVIAGCIVGVVGWYFMDIELIIGNQGHVVAYTEITLFILFVLLFMLFVAISVYKLLYFSANQGKQLSMGSLGSFFAMIAVGCPACSITLASYIGLASILSVLPYGGLELKIVGIIVLLYAVISSLKSLHICSITQKKQIDTNRSVRLFAYMLGVIICLRAVIDYGVKNNRFKI